MLAPLLSKPSAATNWSFCRQVGGEGGGGEGAGTRVSAVPAQAKYIIEYCI